MRVSALCFVALALSSAAFAENPSPTPPPGVNILNGNVLDPTAACSSLFDPLPPKFVAGTLNEGGCLLPLSENCANVTERAPDSEPHMSPLQMNCHYRAWQQNTDGGWQCVLATTCLSYIVSYTCLSPDDGATPDQNRSTWFDRGTRCGDVMEQARQACETGCTNGAYNVANCNVTVTY